MKTHDEEWPEFLEEIEPQTDVKRIDEDLRAKGIKVKSKIEGEITAELQPGERLSLHWQEIELELGATGFATIFVEGEPVWSGLLEEIEHLHTYSSSIDKTLCGLAVNGKIVWMRR
jgi:hypothetical protein